MDRRGFVKLGMQSMGALAVSNVVMGAEGAKRVPLGLDAHSLRGMRWKAGALLKYAALQNVDALLLNTPNYFESLDDAYLRNLAAEAESKGIRIYTGAGGICEKSTTFSPKFGSAEQTLALGIRIARILGSPVVNCRIGMINDRFTEGGIEARMEEVIEVLKALRSQAEDANLKFAFENHAGDLRTEEILTIIEEVGSDICGSMLDPGNGLWALEDPMVQVKKMGAHVLCTSVRDYTVWESEGGATFQWTAIGDGLMDAPEFARSLAANSPGVPLFVETISNSPRPLPFLTKEHMAGFPKLGVSDVADFLRLWRKGKPIAKAEPPAGMAPKAFEQQHQKAELLKSFDYLRKHCNVGLKTVR